MTMTDDLMPTQSPPAGEQETSVYTESQESSLRKAVERCLHSYFEQLDRETITGLYELVLAEVEAPLLEAVLRHTGSNQSKASVMLGLNRGTLRKKLKQHDLL